MAPRHVEQVFTSCMLQRTPRWNGNVPWDMRIPGWGSSQKAPASSHALSAEDLDTTRALSPTPRSNAVDCVPGPDYKQESTVHGCTGRRQCSPRSDEKTCWALRQRCQSRWHAPASRMKEKPQAHPHLRYTRTHTHTHTHVRRDKQALTKAPSAQFSSVGQSNKTKHVQRQWAPFCGVKAHSSKLGLAAT